MDKKKLFKITKLNTINDEKKSLYFNISDISRFI